MSEPIIVILVPSRGRPERMAAMSRSAVDTAAGPIIVVAIVDADDPRRQEYDGEDNRLGGRHVCHTLPERLGYTGSLNAVAPLFWNEDAIIGAFGDDVIFRTPGWDERLRETLATPGIAYGDDVIHGKNHPSAVFMSSAIARALGWLALPATSHQWADDGWKQLGKATGLLRFMDGVVFEHEHPAVNKAEWDDTYRAVFDSDRAKSDYDGFTGWVESGGLEADANTVRRVVG